MSMFDKALHTSATSNATARKTHTKAGVVVEEKEENIDGFQDLLKENGNATISCSLTKGIDFNSEKIVFHVGVRCDQDEKTMDLAAERVFSKTLEYLTESIEALGWNGKVTP